MTGVVCFMRSILHSPENLLFTTSQKRTGFQGLMQSSQPTGLSRYVSSSHWSISYLKSEAHFPSVTAGQALHTEFHKLSKGETQNTPNSIFIQHSEMGNLDLLCFSYL